MEKERQNNREDVLSKIGSQFKQVAPLKVKAAVQMHCDSR